MQFSKQDHWSMLPFPSPGGLPDPGIEHGSPILTGRFFTSEPPGKPPESRDHLSPVWKILGPGDPFSHQSILASSLQGSAFLTTLLESRFPVLQGALSLILVTLPPLRTLNLTLLPASSKARFSHTASQTLEHLTHLNS